MGVYTILQDFIFVNFVNKPACMKILLQIFGKIYRMFVQDIVATYFIRETYVPLK